MRKRAESALETTLSGGVGSGGKSRQMESQPENTAALAAGQRWPDVAQHKLFRHVRYHEVDVFEFEQQGAQH